MKEKLKSWFTHNLGLKALSILIAGVIWIIIMSLSDPKITITIENITIERRNEDSVLRENMTYDITTSDKIDIKVKGARSVLETVSASDFIAYVDFNEIGFNAVQIHVEVKDASKSSLVEIVSQSSSNMGISIVETETESFAVEVKTSNVDDGYYAFCSSASSKLLYVTGSKTQMERVDHLVATIDLSGKTESYLSTVTLTPVDKEGNEVEGVELQQNRIQVEITILPVKNDVPVVLDTSKIHMAEGFGISGIEYSPKTISIAAEPDVLAGISQITISYEARDLMKSEEGEVDITKYLPSGVYLKSESPTVYVSIQVELLKSKDIVVNTSNIEIRGLNEEYVANFTDGVVTVSVYGLESEISNITADDLALYVDMETCTRAGTYSVFLKSDSEVSMDTNIRVGIVVRPAEVRDPE